MPAVIFVHGINSTCESAFANMLVSFREDRRFDDWYLRTFDYDYNDSIRRNGTLLREYLERDLRGEDIVIIAHSLGGLVSRFACLTSGERSRALRLIMLATPNTGALSAHQLTLLAQGFAGAVGRLGIYFRKPGLKDLTRVAAVFEEAYGDDLNETTTEYVTIPATYFHEQRGDVSFNPLAFRDWSTRFGMLNATSLLSSALLPMFAFRMEKPHDGIVEERSVSLFAPKANWSGYWSEKSDSINGSAASEKSYAHVLHRSADSLHHIDVTQDPRMIGVVKSLVRASSLPQWIADNDGHDGIKARA